MLVIGLITMRVDTTNLLTLFKSHCPLLTNDSRISKNDRDFFTHDYFLIPSSLKVYEEEGRFSAYIQRECPNCVVLPLPSKDCSICLGSGTAAPEKEQLIKFISPSIFEDLPTFLNCPDLEHWKQYNAKALKLLYEDGSDFASGLKRQLDAGLFLTTRQLQSFKTSFGQGSETPIVVRKHVAETPLTSCTDIHVIRRYNPGDVVKVIIAFTEIRAQYSKSSGSKFFTYTGMTNLGGFAFTDKSQDAVELGESYTLTGKIRHFFTYDSTSYAITSVARLTRNANTA